MRQVQTTAARREDSFLSSRGIDQSTVVMIGGILLVAFLLLSLIGRGTGETPSSDVRAEPPAVAVDDSADIAGSDIAGTGSGNVVTD